jgi:hypothetical protein
MNRNTAGGLRSACNRVLEALGDDWEQTNISELDVEETLLRFQNPKKKDFLPQVLEEYKQRFRKAVRSYLEYLANPGGWKPSAQENSTAAQRGSRARKPPRQPIQLLTSTATGSGFRLIVHRRPIHLSFISFELFLQECYDLRCYIESNNSHGWMVARPPSGQEVFPNGDECQSSN